MWGENGLRSPRTCVFKPCSYSPKPRASRGWLSFFRRRSAQAARSPREEEEEGGRGNFASIVWLAGWLACLQPPTGAQSEQTPMFERPSAHPPVRPPAPSYSCRRRWREADAAATATAASFFFAQSAIKRPFTKSIRARVGGKGRGDRRVCIWCRSRQQKENQE